METVARYESSTILPGLFVRYVTGSIAAASWDAFMDALDMADITPQEREAFARFYNDALSELGSEAVRIPKLDEVGALLAAVRLS